MARVVKVPIIMQMEALECGAACLCMVMAYHGKWLPLEQLREECGVSRDGSKASSLVIVARAHGLKAQGYRKTLRACGISRCQRSSTGTLITLWSSAASRRAGRC